MACFLLLDATGVLLPLALYYGVFCAGVMYWRKGSLALIFLIHIIADATPVIGVMYPIVPDLWTLWTGSGPAQLLFVVVG